MRVNLYNLHFLLSHSSFQPNKRKEFFITSLSHPSNQTTRGKSKVFSIPPFFYPLFIFYPLTFPNIQPNGPLEPMESGYVEKKNPDFSDVEGSTLM